MTTAGTRKWWALGALSASGLVIGLDITVLNVALPSLATALPATTSDLQWVANSYNLVFAALLLPAGLLGDRLGRRKLLLAALALFGVASLACAYASSAAWLIGARALLGLGAAFVVPLCMSVLPVLFTAQERGRAIGLWVTANAVGLPLGPIVGGWLLDHYWWGAVFLINIPVIAIALIAVLLLVPESRSSQRHRLDLAGILLSCAGLAFLTWGVIELGDRGVGTGAPVAAVGVGVALLGAFVACERRVDRRPDNRPLVDLALFRSANFAWATVLATVVTFALLGALFALPQYFQAVLDADALGTGLRLLPLIGGVLLGARLGARLVPRFGTRGPVTIGFLVLAAGLFAGTATGTGYPFVAGWLTAVGLGMGLVLPIATDIALGTLPVERSGAGSALVQALRQVGGTIGVATLGSVLNAVYRDRLDPSRLPTAAADTVRDSAPAGVLLARALDAPALLDSVREAFVDALAAMLWVCGGLGLLGAVLAFAFLPRRTGPVAAAPVGRPVPETGESGQVTVG